MDQVIHERFHFCAGQFKIEMQGLTIVYFHFYSRRQFNFGFFGRIFDPLESLCVFFEIQSIFFFKFIHNPIHDDLIKIISAQMGVTISGLDFKYSASQFQNRNIKCASAQIINRHCVGIFFVQTIGQSGSGWFINNPFYFQSRNFTSLFSGLALRIVKISRDRNDC